MTTRPPAELRRLVIRRANERCEYCLIPQMFTASAHQIDHIIAEKHNGSTTAYNLALSCMICNLRKGSDISSVDPETKDIVPLFHPRRMIWSEHFALTGSTIEGKTACGRTTAWFLRLNEAMRITERAALLAAGLQLTADIKKPR